MNSFNRKLDCTFAETLVQYPGGVVYLNNLVHHSVLLRYQPETAEIDLWGSIFGKVGVLENEQVESFTYATKIASGSRRESKDVLVALLSAYCVMEDGEWHAANYEEEKRRFLANLPVPKIMTRASKAAKWNKKKRRIERMKFAREAKKQKKRITKRCNVARVISLLEGKPMATFMLKQINICRFELVEKFNLIFLSNRKCAAPATFKCYMLH
ncbi:hypothetical protein GQ600_19633 [Phytophthora cactorum]|nr:hypothetical protein GQ600_19633 [Phytophthora cactorum]